MITVRVNKNIYGNYNCFVRTDKVAVFGNQWDALEWLTALLSYQLYKISDKSFLQ